MKQLWLDFWTTKSAAIRTIRVLMTVGGSVLVGASTPLPEDYRWVGYVIAGLGGALTGRDTSTGLPGGKPAKPVIGGN